MSVREKSAPSRTRRPWTAQIDRSLPSPTDASPGKLLRNIRAGLVVISLHVALVGGLFSAFIDKGGVQPGPSRTMVVLLVPNERLPPKPIAAVADLKLQPIPPHFEIPAVSPIPVAVETPGSILKAAAAESPPFERLISEAQAQNGKFLQQYCAQQVRQVTGADPSGTIVMMIRVESDGHVSDSKVEQSGGAPAPDEIAQSCISQVGIFEPHHKGDQTVASWQRIHWTWTGT